MAVWSEDAITKFISIYKKHPCLWRVKSNDYKNRALRNRAYQELVAYCRKIGFRSANKDFAVKKIQSLRGSFRKELRKIMYSLENAKSEEDAYKPSLFYFDMLMFTKDQEINDDDNDDTMVDTNQDEDSNDDSWNNGEDVKNIATIQLSPYPDTSTSNALSIDGRFCQRDEESNANSSKKGLKRKHAEKTGGGEATLAAISETDAFGIIVSRKLSKMNRLQSVYAETIIINVLRKGLLDTLTADTDLCDNHCSKNFIG